MISRKDAKNAKKNRKTLGVLATLREATIDQFYERK